MASIPPIPATPPPRPPTPPSPRLESVDALRGLVMVLMALDHVRDFFSNATVRPEDLQATTPALFLTRWITHLCAPVFLFLAGAGAYLHGAKGRSTGEISRYLFTRGLWLVFLEATLVNWGWSFQLSLHSFEGQVIWAIGASMIALAALVHLPRGVLVAFSLLMIALHNAFDHVRFPASDWRFIPWSILHAGEMIRFGRGVTLFPLYPLIPWIGVMAAGYAFGPVLTRPAAGRRVWTLGLGAALLGVFVGLRFTNLYGDPHPWAPQRSAAFTVFSFLNCDKYPPSLLYLLMTLGPALLWLGLADRFPRLNVSWLVVFGRVPLFYYLAHLYLAHASAGLLCLLTGRPDHARWVLSNATFGSTPVGYGYPLGVVYLAWVAIVAALYPACRWYADFKRRHRHPVLSYL